jgi:hypothetical protein
MMFYFIITLEFRQADGQDNVLTRTGRCDVGPDDTYGTVFTRLYRETCDLVRLDLTGPAGTGPDGTVRFNVVCFELRRDTPLLTEGGT